MRKSWRFFRVFVRAWFVFYFRIRTFGARRIPSRGGVLLVANHQSYLDPPLVTAAAPREASYMARDSLFRGPFGKLIAFLNAYPVKRGEVDVGAMKETLRRLKRGDLVVVFPEATRTVDGEIGPMRPGVVLLARKARVPILPTLVLGAYQAWPRWARFPRPRPIIIAYGEPVSAAEVRDMDEQACIDRVRARIVALKRRYERHSVFAAAPVAPRSARSVPAADRGCRLGAHAADRAGRDVGQPSRWPNENSTRFPSGSGRPQ